ncbi:hypothetical protein DSCO28_32040 [Desulfosarcina ovata subsp. sediminis]|uniref:histidine kinase n=1 Tax=Desulfosarcina ovata subsp. sediminis TaxID=885957 RepID=A0A5K7ZK78_9BACT|nr:ATP-binding protein [Desulfosarcina ovata]BBO82638.1 hypothetical protein DSCO28_32040 [Desulfosarcina ovata subsp. sediminis]
MKFATKIFITVFLSTALIISGMVIAAHFWISNHHMQTHLRFARMLARLAALKSENYILRNDRVELYRFYQSILQVNPSVDYIFAEKAAEILVHTFDTGVPKGLLRLGAINTPDTAIITPVANNQGDLIYHIRVKLGAPAETILHFGLSDKKIRAELHSYRMLMLIVGIIMLATVPVGLALFLSRFISKPLYALKNGVKRIGRGELDYRLALTTGDEIEQLVHEINTMAAKLEKARNGLQAEIDERKQAERELANQTELLNNILNNVPHHIFWKDRESIFMGCNAAFARMAGLTTPAEVVGKSDDDLPWEKTESDAYRQIDRQIVETGTAMVDIEEVLTRADGQKKTVITSKVPLHEPKGNVSGILGIFYDITERKRMEETIKQTQKMEAIGTLAGGIAHDFNNILGSIIGYSELAIDDIACDDRTCGYLQQVLKSAMRAKDLVRQILTFSRKSREERKPIPLAAIVKEEAKLLRSTLPSTIEIRQHIDDNAGMVNADLTQMHQIVMNLCTNAAHAMSVGGGVLDITLAPIDLTPEQLEGYHGVSPGPFLELKIADTGTGIHPAVIHRIFEPFFTTKEKEKGTGMGLAVVHGIVKDHGGDITVQSHPGQGTSFTVILPRVVSDTEKKVFQSYTAPGGNERVLLIDDETTLLNLGKSMLESMGYQVTAVNGSLEALEIFQHAADAFDLVITDQTMPHMTGYHLARRMMAIHPSTRIILCTGYSDAITPEKVSAAGIRALLFKPISKNELGRTARDVIDGNEK